MNRDLGGRLFGFLRLRLSLSVLLNFLSWYYTAILPVPVGLCLLMLILAFSWFLAHLGGTTGVGLEEGLDLTDMSLALARGLSAELILIIK